MTLLGLLLLLCQSLPFPGPGGVSALSGAAIVQGKAVNSSTSPITLVFTTTPVVGRLLIVGVSSDIALVSPPSGWSTIDSVQVSNAPTFAFTFEHVVGSSEANSYAFTATGGGAGLVAYEISGQAGSGYINQHAITVKDVNSVLSRDTPSATPSVIPTLAIGFAFRGYVSGSTLTAASGWTDTWVSATWRNVAGAYVAALTTDISTPISRTFTFNTATAIGTSIILVK